MHIIDYKKCDFFDKEWEQVMRCLMSQLLIISNIFYSNFEII